MFCCRTDLALERRDGLDEVPEGVVCREETRDGLHVTRIEVRDARGARALQKPPGRYLTAELEDGLLGENDWIWRAAQAVGALLRPLLPAEGMVLAVGLGNRAVTPDALGPLCIEHLIVTRHLIERMPREFGGLRPVCALTPGVLGTTGIETLELVRGAAARVRPAAVVAVDALAARAMARLCRTFQLSDTGIAPGSGAGNHRAALDRAALGVPVIAAGVPTVVDALTLCADLLGAPEELPAGAAAAAQMLVAPKDVDLRVRRCAKALGYGLNLALQGGMTLSEMEQYLA